MSSNVATGRRARTERHHHETYIRTPLTSGIGTIEETILGALIITVLWNGINMIRALILISRRHRQGLCWFAHVHDRRPRKISIIK